MTRASRRSTERFRLASIEITLRCNNRCPTCEQPRGDRDMSPIRFARLLDELAAEGFEALALGGGEPTLHPALPAFLEMVHEQGLPVGLTTNARDPELVQRLADADLLDMFGVSAGKGEWLRLVAHPRAIVNLLLTKGNLTQVMAWAVEAVQSGAHCLLLLGYKGSNPRFTLSQIELSGAFGLFTHLGHMTKVTVATDDYIRRRLGLIETCGEGFLRIDLDGNRDHCCFSVCEYRTKVA